MHIRSVTLPPASTETSLYVGHDLSIVAAIEVSPGRSIETTDHVSTGSHAALLALTRTPAPAYADRVMRVYSNLSHRELYL